MLMSLSSEKDEIGGACRKCSGGERRDSCRGLVGKPKAKRTLGRTRRRWEDNIKMYIQEIGRGTWSGLNWLSTGRCC